MIDRFQSFLVKCCGKAMWVVENLWGRCHQSHPVSVKGGGEGYFSAVLSLLSVTISFPLTPVWVHLSPFYLRPFREWERFGCRRAKFPWTYSDMISFCLSISGHEEWWEIYLVAVRRASIPSCLWPSLSFYLSIWNECRSFLVKSPRNSDLLKKQTGL